MRTIRETAIIIHISLHRFDVSHHDLGQSQFPVVAVRLARVLDGSIAWSLTLSSWRSIVGPAAVTAAIGRIDCHADFKHLSRCDLREYSRTGRKLCYHRPPRRTRLGFRRNISRMVPRPWPCIRVDFTGYYA